MSERRNGLHTDIPTIFKDLNEPQKAHFPRFVAGSVTEESQLNRCAKGFKCYKLVFAKAGQVRVIKDGKVLIDDVRVYNRPLNP
jgi:hypothetical protein